MSPRRPLLSLVIVPMAPHGPDSREALHDKTAGDPGGDARPENLLLRDLFCRVIRQMRLREQYPAT